MCNQSTLVGTWEVMIPQAEGNPRPTFEAILTFFADGNMVEVNSMNPAITGPARGRWIGSGNTYLITFGAFTFDDQGQCNGKVKAHLSLKMEGVDHFSGQYTADIIDLAGKVTKKVIYGPFTGTRMEVELP